MPEWTGMDGKPLPAAGTAFLVPVTEGKWTFAWVVGHDGKRESDVPGRDWDVIRIACATWIGDRPPTPAELDAREVVELTDVRGKRFGPLVLKTVKPEVPSTWKRIGTLKEPWVEHEPLWDGAFWYLEQYASQMWNAKHAPAKVKELAQSLEKEEAEGRAEKKKVLARRRATLAQLSRMALLPEWESLTTKRRRTTLERWLAELVDSLTAAGKKATRKDKLALLEAAVEKINAWKGSSDIDGPERDALVNAIDDIGRAAGLRGRDLAGPYREW